MKASGSCDGAFCNRDISCSPHGCFYKWIVRFELDWFNQSSFKTADIRNRKWEDGGKPVNHE